MSTRPSADEPFGEPFELGSTINTDDFEGGPALSTDNTTLLFHANRPGGLGGHDLWMAAIEPPKAPEVEGGVLRSPREVDPDNANSSQSDKLSGSGEDTAGDIRTWTDTSGKTVEAAIVDVKDGTVRLRLPDGKIASVALDRLCDEDRAYIGEQTEQNDAP
jgi:hypothetical protein